MQTYSREFKNFKLIHFEDILKDPFKMSSVLYQFLNLCPVQLNKLRLKSKKIINKDGNHEEAFGIDGQKYWFDRENIHEIIDPDVNKNQLKNLPPEAILIFNEQASKALKLFGYEIIHPK